MSKISTSGSLKQPWLPHRRCCSEYFIKTYTKICLSRQHQACICSRNYRAAEVQCLYLCVHFLLFFFLATLNIYPIPIIKEKSFNFSLRSLERKRVDLIKLKMFHRSSDLWLWSAVNPKVSTICLWVLPHRNSLLITERRVFQLVIHNFSSFSWQPLVTVV